MTSYVRSKQVVSTIVLIYFGKPPFRHSIKTNFMTFQTADLEMLNFDFL